MLARAVVGVVMLPGFCVEASVEDADNLRSEAGELESFSRAGATEHELCCGVEAAEVLCCGVEVALCCGDGRSTAMALEDPKQRFVAPLWYLTTKSREPGTRGGPVKAVDRADCCWLGRINFFPRSKNTHASRLSNKQLRIDAVNTYSLLKSDWT